VTAITFWAISNRPNPALVLAGLLLLGLSSGLAFCRPVRYSDHFVGTGVEHGRNIDIERPRSLEIYHQLEKGRLHDREVPGLVA
jgi:hypothetical protein